MRSALLVVFAALAAFGAPAADISGVRWLPLTHAEAAALADESGQLHDLPLWYTPYNTARPTMPRRVELIGDRRVYFADDTAQFLLHLVGEPIAAPGARIALELVGDNGELRHTVAPVKAMKMAFTVRLDGLPAGNYEMRARLGGVADTRPVPPWRCRLQADRRPAESFPADGVPLLVHPQQHVPHAVWPISTGVPLPRHSLDDVDRLRLLEEGRPVTAQFSPRATWQPDGRQLKWVGLDFMARYDGNQPRQYRIVLDGPSAPATDTPLLVTEDADRIHVNTGAVQFSVGRRRFAGVEDVRLIGADGTAGEPLVVDGGGPFLQDERHVDYAARLDEATTVTIEDRGPVKATIAALGWYTSSRNERCCLYETRISAYAGSPRVDIFLRTVITFDTDRKRLRRLGFHVPTAGATGWTLGIDGQQHAGELPESGTVWLHQDRWDHCRLSKGDDDGVSDGIRSDGWASLNTPHGSALLLVRNLWQMFPKELELGRDRLDLHVWPRHGADTFADAEELDYLHIHKLWYAHEGEYLDLRFPQKYFDAFPAFLQAHPNPTERGGCFLEQQDINALTGNAQGVATSTYFSLVFTREAPQRPDAQAALFQQAPHAISDPTYNGLSGVEGRFAGRRQGAFGEIEQLFEIGYRGFTQSVDILEDYGMWIWPDTHNNWSLGQRVPQTHRWWTHAHYQGVWEATFLYWRSGVPWLKTWAADNYEHFANVGTVNYHDPAHRIQGHLTGANYHTKGFTPWGSPRHTERTGDDYVEVGAHFINPDAHVLRYLLTGDRRAIRLAEGWFRSLGAVALPPERSREACTTLGELVSYYQTTWDPQAIAYIRDLADDLVSRPWTEIPAHPGHTLYHDRWLQRYWSLTGDERVRERLFEWFRPAPGKSVNYGYPQVRALAWRLTGDVDYLTAIAPGLVGVMRSVYVNQEDPQLTGFGGRGFFFPTHSLGQMVPYYLQALVDAGLALPEDGLPPKPVLKAVRPAKGKASDWFALDPDDRYSQWWTGYLHPHGDEAAVTLTFTGTSDRRYGGFQPGICAIIIEDADGNVLLDTNVLETSRRPSVEIALDAGRQPAPWKLTRNRRGNLTWTGPAESVTFSPHAELEPAE